MSLVLVQLPTTAKKHHTAAYNITFSSSLNTASTLLYIPPTSRLPNNLNPNKVYAPYFCLITDPKSKNSISSQTTTVICNLQ